jgi:hypothetical protein
MNIKMTTHRQRFLKKVGLDVNESYSLSELARIAKVPVKALQEVYERGEGAYSNNPESVRVKGTFAKNPSLKQVPLSGRLSMAQWAMARVYSFLDKGKTYKTTDKDIATKYKI